MKHPLASVLAAAALSAALLAAGCGDDDEEASGAEALPKEEFVAQANAICKQGGEEIDQAATEAFGRSRPSPEEIEEFAAETVIPSVQEQIDELETLGPPEGEEDQVQEILDSAQAALDELEADPAAVAAGGSADDPFAETNQLAKAYGLDECAG